MRSNASILAALFLLSGCGGGFGYGPETLPAAERAPQGYGSNYQAPQDPYDDPYAAPAPAPVDPYSAQAQQGGYERPDAGFDAPGAGYGRPGEQVAQRPAPRADRRPPQNNTPAPRPQQQDEWQDPTVGAAGPAASSSGNGEARYDKVGYAGVRSVQGGPDMEAAVVAISPVLPAGTFVEITSLDTGKTILALVTGTGGEGGGSLIELSPAAARQLGASGDSIPVRVRKSTPTGPDQTALNNGQAAALRPDTPPVLLNALRKQLPAYAPVRSAAPAPAPAYARPAAPSTRQAAHGRYYVQVAALSNSVNAANLARSLGGFVKSGGGLHRVQMGPFASPAEANRARASAAQRGFGDARVFTQN